MEQNIQFYKDYFYPVIVLDGGLVTVYKNEAAKAAKLKPRAGVHIKKYVNEKNLKILLDIAEGRAGQQVVELEDELEERLGRCLAMKQDSGMTALIFFDSLNFIKDYDAETAERIGEIASRYGEQMLPHIGDPGSKKIQKLRGYFNRHIANTDAKSADFEKSYCDIWEFLNHFNKGAAAFIKSAGYNLAVDAGENKMFMHRLNESDFLTLNFILVSYALSKSVFGTLTIRFEYNIGALIYEFERSSADKLIFEEGGLENCGNIDLELAALIAANNNLKLEFGTDEDNISAQILVRFKASGDLWQPAAGANIIGWEEIEARAEIELAFLSGII